MISIILPVYNEENQIYASVQKIRTILLSEKLKNQIILIDDGSTDESWSEMQRLTGDFNNVFLLKLSRNLGKEAALCAGLEAADGDACLILDADLQHPPELIPEMVRLWREEGYEVVEGVKATRGNETLGGKIAAMTYYRLFNKATGINLTNASDFKLLDRKVVEAWKSLKEADTFFRGMSAWLGYKRIQIPFEVQERREGISKWSVQSLVKLAIDSITSFSTMPLHIITGLGIGLLLFDVVLVGQTLYMKFSGQAFTGFTTVIILTLGIGSCIMISLGIIGIYISKIYDEVKGRPRYIITEQRKSEVKSIRRRIQ
ncbi:glycosyl transferase [Desulfitobacterium dichloroeliminans LMG P-21439]|uniref:Glycosyl transferase n=1 Tax=Desulfitobacterium dichloroeliminans (strain LMG P-21439 / DCA1) TaxID=871963 RepID=L0F5N6_DESDL|nr:glycosyltransferase family 2 protein [Desulfitobacterium dichloroeliminans]AGA69129.1 glycosyl transferase [Desulfitobacterium dichloroeliminans LMG P-21439]